MSLLERVKHTQFVRTGTETSSFLLAVGILKCSRSYTIEIAMEVILRALWK